MSVIGKHGTREGDNQVAAIARRRIQEYKARKQEQRAREIGEELLEAIEAYWTGS